MDSHFFTKFYLLISISALFLQIGAQGKDSVVFLDSPSHPYLRSSPRSEYGSMSLSEVGAAVSVLLGLAPPASIPSESSSKLNEVLLPNPFDRPRTVFMLELRGIEDPSLLLGHPNFQVGGPSSSHVLLGSKMADIEVSDDEVSVVSLDEPAGIDSDVTDKQLQDFATWLGGSYVGSLDAMDAKLTFPLKGGASLNLDMSKEADREYAVSLASMFHGIRMAGQMHEDFAGSMQSPSELVTGCFTGIKALQERYGPGDIAEQGIEVFLKTLMKLFDSLQAAYKGQIVGVILFNEKSSSTSGSMLNVKISTRASRSMEEEGPLDSTAILVVLLVRRSLAWITGIILLIATLIGVYFLLNMPLTRDTLLYSNVKLD